MFEEKPSKIDNETSQKLIGYHIKDTVNYFYYGENLPYNTKIVRKNGRLIIAMVVTLKDSFDVWNFYDGRSCLSKTHSLKNCVVDEVLEETIRSISRLIES